jgi:hypothetical protein
MENCNYTVERGTASKLLLRFEFLVFSVLEKSQGLNGVTHYNQDEEISQEVAPRGKIF